MFMGIGIKKKKTKDSTEQTAQSKERVDRKGARRVNSKSDDEPPSVNKSLSRQVRQQANDCKSLVHGFVQNTLKKGVIGLRTEFASHKRINDLTKMTIFQKNSTKNRYKDVGCLDDTRVVLTESDCDYIHANYVSTPNSDKRFICCQAPLDSTCADHWRMIVQEKVEVILMLCNLLEKGAKKCSEYFPTTNGKSEKTFDKYTIKAVKSKKMTFPFSTTAIINITSLVVEVGGKVVHSVDHYHWVDWPDRGVPPADLAPIILLNKVMGTTNPVIVHCSAGIGRTGSIVLLQYTLESIAAGQTCENIDVLMVKLRKQRANSVQTDQQYLYVHQVLLNYFLKEGYLDKSVVQFLEAFTNDYKKAVITG